MYVTCDWCGKTFYKKKKDKRYSGNYCSQQCITDRDVSNYKIKFLRENRVFRIITYINKNDVTIACRKCGDIVKTNSTTAMRRKACLACRAKEMQEKERREKERKAEIKQAEKEVRDYRNRVKALEHRLEVAYEKKKRQEEHKKKKAARYKRRELKRERKLKANGIVDKDINLKTLYERDKGICYICGKKCDYNDHRVTKEGYFIIGNNYPTIDHLLPISLGGKHSWENVKLAHMICNSIKGNSPPE